MGCEVSSHELSFTEENSSSKKKINSKKMTVLKIIGSGAFGVVYKVQWGNKIVAVKQVRENLEDSFSASERKILADIKHPNIIKYYGYFSNKIIMEYVEGGNLYSYLHRQRHLTYNAGHAIRWSRHCGRGIAYLHGLTPTPVIHRDLKSSNLLLTNKGHVKICDFGTACNLRTNMSNNKGSPHWMAPEVFTSNNYNEKCDVYSWGAIFWEFLTRKVPFTHAGSSGYQIQWAKANGAKLLPIKNCPEPIEQLIARCCDDDPMNRPDMESVIQEMNQLAKYFLPQRTLKNDTEEPSITGPVEPPFLLPEQFPWPCIEEIKKEPEPSTPSSD